MGQYRTSKIMILDLQRVLAWHGSVGSESSGEESNVVVLVTGDLGESSSDPARVTSGSKVLFRELSKCVGADMLAKWQKEGRE